MNLTTCYNISVIFDDRQLESRLRSRFVVRRVECIRDFQAFIHRGPSRVIRNSDLRRPTLDHSPFAMNRRAFLQQSGLGFGSVALTALLAAEGRAETQRPGLDPLKPLQERIPEFAPQARQVIFLFQYGGPPTFDLIDYKPDLIRLHGQPVPESLKQHPDKVGGVFNHCKDELLASCIQRECPIEQ